MTSDDYARMALGAVAGGIAAVAITKAGILPQSAVLRWIVYCVVAGVLLNTQTGMKFAKLMLTSFVSALGLMGTVLWMVLLGEGTIPSLSGVPIDLKHKTAFASTLLVGLLFVSTAGVAIGAMARPAILELVQELGDIDLEKAKRIESFLKVLVSIAGTAALFLL